MSIEYEKSEIDVLEKLHSRLRADGCEISTVWGPPGTGKTSKAASLWKAWESEGLSPVMVTFSRAARAEMLNRVNAETDSKRLYERMRTLDSVAVKNYQIAGDRRKHEENKDEPWKILDPETKYREMLLDATLVFSAVGSSQTIAKEFLEWLPTQHAYRSSENIANIFSKDDNPLNPGPIWSFIRSRQESLQFLDLDRKQTAQFGQLLWTLYCWEKRVFAYHDAMCYLAFDPAWNIQSEPKAIIVDEAQDLSHLQHYCLLRLAVEYDAKKMAVIGDPNQSIMSFRKATPYPFSDIYLPASENDNNALFLDRTFRFPTQIGKSVERYRQRMGKHWKQDTREVMSDSEGGMFREIKWKDPEEVGYTARKASETYDDVYLLFTNRYVQIWSETEEYLQKLNCPFGFLSGGEDYTPGGICGLEIKDRSAPSKDVKWVFPDRIEKRGAFKFAAVWVNEFLDARESDSEGMTVGRLFGAGRLTRGLMISNWQKKLGSYLMEALGEDKKTVNYDSVSDTEIPAKTAKQYFAERHKIEYESIASGDISILERPDLRARLQLPRSAPSRRSGPLEFPYSRIAEHLQIYSLAECLQPAIQISTVHQAKGRECDVAIFVPTGPPQQNPKEWEVEMMKVYYVGISRGRHMTLIMRPAVKDREWNNTASSEAWKALEDVLAKV